MVQWQDVEDVAIGIVAIDRKKGRKLGSDVAMSDFNTFWPRGCARGEENMSNGYISRRGTKRPRFNIFEQSGKSPAINIQWLIESIPPKELGSQARLA